MRPQAKNSTIARYRGTRLDGTPRWEGRFSVKDPQRPGHRIWIQRGADEHGRPFTSKTDAERWVKVEQARYIEGKMTPDGRKAGVTFAQAADEWLRYVEHDRGVKPTTLREYRSAIEHHLKPAFRGDLREITPQRVEAWYRSLPQSGRTRNKLLTNLHGVFERARRCYGLAANPTVDVERARQPNSGDLVVFSPDEVRALVAAAASEQDAALYLTAAFTGLRRGELIALRWRDVDQPNATIRVRASFAAGAETLPKSNKVRSVPMVPEVAGVLTRLRQRDHHTSDEDLVFTLSGDYLDGDALSKRYGRALKRAKLRPLRFHDLRHVFGTLAITKADIVQVQAMMGHADIKTTQRYLHYRPRTNEAALLEGAFATAPDADVIPLRDAAA